MNKLLLTMAAMVLFGVSIFGQTKISGIVKDSSTDKEVYNLTVSLVETGTEVQTDRIGYFQFVDVKSGTYTLKVSGVGYEDYETQLVVNGEPQIDLGSIMVIFDPTSEEVGIITLTSDELASDESSSQSAAGLLQSSQDVFASTAAFELGAYWFKVRGYDNKYNDVFFNGVRMNKINNDRVNFGDWGGLNDVTRHPAEQTVGSEPSDYAFGDVGGITYFDTRPSLVRKGTSLAYSFTNRSYNQRVLATYNTGLMKNGWAFMGSGARRWAEEGAIEGTFYDSWALFLAAEKKINDKHSLVLSAFGAPTRRSTNSPNTQEVYDLMGKDYNSYWGWQDGEKRSERIRNFFEPIVMLTHHWTISPKSKLTTTLGYQFGKDSRSRLDWFKANNPSPTYYGNLPSYFIYREWPEEAEVRRQQWLSDPSISQINWTNIYNQNYHRGNGGAAYVLSGDVNEDKILTFSTNLKTKIGENFKLITVLNYQNTRSELYREVIDLLGGNYFVNYNAFQKASYNMDEDPNRKIYEGDKYQYDYEISHQRTDLFAQGEYSINKFDITLGLKAAYTSVYRDGKYRHEQYQDNSKGKSKTYDFFDFGTKAQVLYKMNGRNFFQLNAMYATNAPTVDEIFPNARSNDYTIDNYKYNDPNLGQTITVEDAGNLTSSKVFSTDLSYILRAPRIKGRVTGFYTKFLDEYEKNFGYIDEGGTANLFGAEYLYNVDKLFFGGELAVEAQLTTTLTVSAVASIGQYTYDNNPTHQRFSDSVENLEIDNGGSGETIQLTAGTTQPITTYLKNYHLAVGPQQGFSIGLEYRDPHYWWIGATGNYLASNYLDPAPYKRTVDFFAQNNLLGGAYFGVNDESMASLLKQEKFSNEFMLNLNAGKTFRFGKYYMGISANVNNVFNNRDYVTGGFEQLRIGNYADAINPNVQNMFGPKYWYDRGTSYFINVFFRF